MPRPTTTKPKRKIQTPTVRRMLRTARGKRSVTWVLAALKRRGVSVPDSTFRQTESGLRKTPNPIALWALGDLYGIPYTQLLAGAAKDRGWTVPGLGSVQISAGERSLPEDDIQEEGATMDEDPDVSVLISCYRRFDPARRQRLMQVAAELLNEVHGGQTPSTDVKKKA